MNLLKNILISGALLCLVACKEKARTDLAKMTFTEKAADMVNYEDRFAGGVNTLEAPLAFALQASHTSSYTFNGLPLDSVNLIFQLRSDKIRKDSTLYQGGASADQEHVANAAELRKVLDRFQADSVIYAYRLRIKTKELQAAVLQELTKLYGPGTKNPNTTGFYWNLKDLHRLIFYAPDYRVLIVADNTHLSKTCFWDPATGDIDLGGCDMAQYKANLLK